MELVIASAHGFDCLYLKPLFIISFCTAVFIVRALYRLYFHPLSKFPGPRLACASTFYISYYDLIRKGSFVKLLPELHRRYGPIVRIAPDELHIYDRENYNQVFKVGTEYSKEWQFYSPNAIKGSLLSILDTPSARVRRDAYSYFFSRNTIQGSQSILEEITRQFVDILAHKSTEDVIDMSRGFRCLTADVIIRYAYRKEFGGLQSQNFRHPVIEASDKLVKTAVWATYYRITFRGLEYLISWLPKAISRAILPELLTVKEFETNCAKNILELKEDTRCVDSRSSTMFDNLLRSDNRKAYQKLSDAELTAEAVVVFLAGMDTTANALVVGTWSVLTDEEVYRNLFGELISAIPNPKETISIEKLRRLPYLNAVIKESLRLSYGAPGRLPRTVPKKGVVIFGDYIPAGTTISHSNYVYHTDEKQWPEPYKFKPERWLSDEKLTLEKNMTAFSRGSRVCIGMHLAEAELLLTIALMFRCLKLEVLDTTREDMEWRDYGVVIFKGHLKVKKIKVLSAISQ